jgi:O-antigen/teichoic acid export membrane protein
MLSEETNGNEASLRPAARWRIPASYLVKLSDRFLPRNSFKFNVAMLTSGIVVSQVVLLLASPLLTRLYTSSDFGHFQVYLSITVFCTVVASLKYETAVLLPDDGQVGANLLVFALCVTVGMFGVFSVVIWAINRSGVLGEYASGLRPYMWLIPFSAAASGAYQVLNSWALRIHAYRKATIAKVTQSVSQTSAHLLFGLMHLGVPGLLIGEAIGRMGGTLRLARAAWSESADLFRNVRLQGMWFAAVRYKKFPLISASSTLINTAGFAVPSLLIGGWFGASVLGWFALTDRILSVPAALMGQSISYVYTASAARLVNSNPRELRRFFLKTAWHCLLLGVVPFLALAFLGPMLFAFAFGEPWREAGLYAAMLAVPNMISFAAASLMSTLNILERQPLQLVWDLGRMLLTCGILYVAHTQNWLPRWAVFAYGTSMAFGYVCYLGLSYVAITSLINQKEKIARDEAPFGAGAE